MTNPPRDDAPETIWLGYDYAKAIGGKKPRYGNNVEYRRADTPARAGMEVIAKTVCQHCHRVTLIPKDTLAALLPTEAGPPEVQITKLDRPITMDEIEKWDSGCNPTPPAAPTDTALVEALQKIADIGQSLWPTYEQQAAEASHIARAALASRAAPPEAQVTVAGLDALWAEAKAEAEKAMRKFPQPNYVISKVAEEAGEVVKAAIHCAEGRETPENVIGEIRQTIAMLIRLYVEGDGVHGLRALAGEGKA